MSRYYYILMTGGALSALLSCRTRSTAEIKTAPDTTAPKLSQIAVSIEIDLAAFAAANFSHSVSSGDLDLWTMVDDPAMKEKINKRLMPLKLDQNSEITRENLAKNDSAPKATFATDGLKLSAITGISVYNTIPVYANGKRNFIKVSDLSADLFRSCPTDFFLERGPLIPALRQSSGTASIVVEPAGGIGDTPAVKSVEFRADSIIWGVECSYEIAWSDIPETKVLANLTFDFSLTANKTIFPGALADAKYQPLAALELETTRDGKGTRYGVCSAQNQEDQPVIRWSPRRDRIVIDDVHDYNGSALTISDEGRWLQEGLKIAAADLRLKLPTLGKKLVLRSEQPLLTGDISFATIATDKTSPLIIRVRDNTKGEMRHVYLPIGAESSIKGMPAMLKGFEALGLIAHAEKSYKDAYLITVLHDLGHAMGLRHNLSGYGTNNNWGNDLQAVMALPMPGIPMDFLTDKVEWKPHDILSLKILYADLNPDGLRERDDLIKEVLQYPLSAAEDDTIRAKRLIDRQLVAAINYLENTNNPRMIAFRKEHADWKAQIKSIYANAYGIELP